MSAARKPDARRRRGLAFWIFWVVVAVLLLLLLSKCLRGGDAISAGTPMEPKPEVTATPEPETPLPPPPEPQPNPALQPTPEPKPTLQPTPAPQPTPEPEPLPEPKPEPPAEPAREPSPAPAPSPPPAPASPPRPPAVQVGPSRGPSLAEGNAPAAYPLAARRRGLEGTTVVHASIDPTGQVTRAEVARSSGVEEIDAAALDAVRSWRFVPALDRGVAVASEADLPVVFRLRSVTSAGR